MDTINACIESLKKEVVNLEACREHLLSGVTSFSCFEDKTLISSFWLDYYSLCSFISFPHVYFFPPFSLLNTLYFSSTYLISLVWLIYFGFLVYYAIFATATTIFYDTVYFSNTSWSSLLFIFALNYELQMKTYYNAFLWHYPLHAWSLGGGKNIKKRNDDIIFPRYNNVLATCHYWGPLNLFHPSRPNGNTYLHVLPLPQRVFPILVRI